MSSRHDGRRADELRPTTIEPGFMRTATGSALISVGETRVICTASAEGLLERSPLTGSLAAVSCGVIDGAPMLDLDYSEDSVAEVDANVVMTGDGALVEVQATAERTPLSRAHLDDLLSLAAAGIEGLRHAQETTLAEAAANVAGDGEMARGSSG